MAIVKNYKNTAIRRPATYSSSKQDNANGAPLGTLDTIFLIGESDAGAPGSVEGIQSFKAEQISALVAKYESGPLVDCALAAVRPSKEQGVGGAGQILIWKTNASTDAQVTLKESTNTNPLFIVKDDAWGVGGNSLSVTVADGDSARQKIITINRLNDTAEVLGENAATAVISIHYTGNGSAAAMTISGASQAAKVLAVTLTGQSDSSVNQSIMLKNYTIKQLVDFLNAQPGYAAVLLDPTKAANSATDLDPLASTSILSVVNLYRLQQEILAVINSSKRVNASLASTPVPGVPVDVSNAFLIGGARGASANSDFSTGMAKSLAQTYSDMLPCISQDASADISSGDTDPSSSYTLAAVQAAEVAHLVLRGSIKNRKEAQGWTGMRSSTKSAVYAAARTIGSELVQLVMQDVLVLDVASNLTWKHPHVMAAICAGIRLGTEIGEPLTHKFLNVNGFGHYVDPVTGLEGGDFNTDLDGDDAIDAGVTFAESATGGIRIVVDNTTYGIDQSFVFNRGSVMEASQYIAQTLRATGDQVFIGKKLPAARVSGGKISGGAAVSLKNVLRNKLIELNAPNVNITSSSIDAPLGFVEETFVVTVNGNTALVEVEVKPVQGLDFIFISFTLGDIKQSA